MKKKWKADEMEMAVNFKSMRISWVFVGVALVAWCLVFLIKDGDVPFIPFMILCIQNIIFFSCTLIYKRMLSGNEKKMDKKNEE